MASLGDKLSDTVHNVTANLPEALITLVIGIIAVEIGIVLLSFTLRLVRIPEGLRKVLLSIGRAFLWVILFVVVIQALGLNNILLALTGSSVIVALLLSTGVAPIVTDVLAGISLGSDRDFQPGNVLKVGDRQTEGEVLSMDARKVRLRDKHGKIHVIPNSVIERNEWVIVGNARSTKRRK